MEKGTVKWFNDSKGFGFITPENGERKGRFKFFETFEQTNPTLVQPIDAVAAFVLVYLNLVQENPGDIGVKKDLAKPIVQRLLINKSKISI